MFNLTNNVPFTVNYTLNYTNEITKICDATNVTKEDVPLYIVSEVEDLLRIY